ncbi:DoxX family protein [Terriglobus roseus]|uniref:Thiosulfate dehydrogenase [quinone] large subunit n=1 Tax=Terriglobus roseus TaxID=392734 RepID=A0A1G7J047_9BACT|nr:DoxX family protein [Terriglobus roseus]SDF18327.1 thiosulfate dehydrogenase [quinone] large subunit [Terriglobus roseus]
MLRDHKAVAYAIMRLALGMNIFGHGFFRILSGVGNFASGMAQGMDKGPLPHVLTLSFGYCIPWIELTVGLLIILGLFTRFALASGALLMVALTFGTTSVQNWNGAGTQLMYSFIFFAMLWLVEANTFSVDGLLSRRK